MPIKRLHRVQLYAIGALASSIVIVATYRFTTHFNAPYVFIIGFVTFCAGCYMMGGR